MFVGTFVWLSNWLLPEVRDAIELTLGDFAASAAWLLSAIAIAVAGIFAFYVAFPAIVRVVAAPFLALLADRVFADVSGHEAPTPPGSRFMRWGVRPIVDALTLLAVRIVVTVIALPLLCVPVVGAGLFFAAMLPLEGLDLMDLAQGARAVPLRERLRFVRKHLPASTGLGLGAAGVLLIPVVNVFCLPALVVGAVLLDSEVSPDFPWNDGSPDGGSPNGGSPNGGSPDGGSPDGASSSSDDPTTVARALRVADPAGAGDVGATHE